MLKDRTPRPKRENGQALSSYQRALISDRESALWMNSKQDFKPLLDLVELVCVNDRGADFYEHYWQLFHDGMSFVIRAGQKERVVAPVDNPEERIHLYGIHLQPSSSGRTNY